MGTLTFHQINLVLTDVEAAVDFLRSLGVEVPPAAAGWEEWAPHHVGFPAVAEGFDADLDSSVFAAHWGGLPAGFTGVVVNLRAEDRTAVDATVDRALTLGASVLRAPYDAFWGSRYAVISAPGPLTVGIMSPVDPAHAGPPPALSDFT